MTRGQEGAVVIEALVAALILAALAAALFTTLRGDAAAARQVANRRQALLLARSVLAAAAVDPAQPRAGTADGLRWRLTVRALPAGDGGSSLGPVDELVVTVRGATPDARPLAILPTLRFAQ